jgi:hypothetical protein
LGFPATGICLFDASDSSSAMLEFFKRRGLGRGLAGLLGACLLAGCATGKIDWGTRIGAYTYDEAVREYGPPDKSAKLSDGTSVHEWLTWRGRDTTSVHTYRGRWFSRYDYVSSPDEFLRLTFGPDDRLKEWKRVMK